MSYRQLRQAILLVLGLVLVLSAVSYSNLLQRGYVVMKFSALLVGATALLAMCGFLIFQDRRWKELRDPLFYLLAAEVGVLLVSIAFSGQPMVSLLGSMPRLMGSITIFCFLVAAVAVVLGAGRRRENVLFLLRVLAATSIAVSLNAIYEWPTHPIFRPPGLVGNAEFLSNYLLFGSLGSLSLLLVERRRSWWIFAAIAAAITSVAMAVLKTRGAWLGYGAGIVAFLLVAKPWKQSPELVRQTLIRLLVLLAAAFCAAIPTAIYGIAKAITPIGWTALLPFLPVAGIAFLPLPWLLPRVRVLRHGLVALIIGATALTGYFVTTQTSFLPHKVGKALRVTQESARGIVREDTTSMLKKYWLTGCGLENYRVAFLEFKSERVARADPRVNYRNPHNMLLYEWTANGLFGVLVYVGLIVVGLWSLILARRREEDTPWGMLAAGLMATLVAYLVHNVFNYDVIPTGLMFYVLLGMAMVLRRTAGESPVVAEATDAKESEEPTPEEPARRTKRKRRRKKAAPTGRARRAAQRMAERKSQESSWMMMSLIWGGSGAALLFMLLWGVPGIREAFSFSIVELRSPTSELPVKTDILPWILMLSWIGFWLVTLFCGAIFKPGQPEDSDAAEDARISNAGWFTLVAALVVCVSGGLWWSSKQIQADYHMFRALAYSRAAGRNVIPSVQRVSSRMRSLQRQKAMLRRQGRLTPALEARFESQQSRLDLQRRKMAPLLAKLLRRAVAHGRAGAYAVNSLGYYHFQYSKVLHPFLKARGMLKGYNAIVLESLMHARRSIQNNTNPESAWSHLSVVYLAGASLDPRGAPPVENAYLERYHSDLQETVRANSLSLGKWALAKSISHDKFYYDTHRMMALLHLQSGHIDLAVKEMNRSLDITEGKHWTQSRAAAVAVRRAVTKGDDKAAEKARRELWYWLKRSRNLQGAPVVPLLWAVADEKSQKLQTVAKLMARGRYRQAGKRLRALGKERGVKRVSTVYLRFLNGVHAMLVGDSGRAFELLRNLYRLRSKSYIDSVIQLVSMKAQVVGDVDRMLRAVQKGKADAKGARRVLAQAVERSMNNPGFYLKIFAFLISEIVNNGEMERAKSAAKIAAQFAYLLHSRQRTDYFSGGFRRMYRQVLSARGQVFAAATKRGRIMRAQRMLQQRKYEGALRISQGILKKFGPKVPLAHFFMGGALEALGRSNEAKESFQRYLVQDPNGKYADRVKKRLERL